MTFLLALKDGDSSGHPLGFLLHRRLPAPVTRLGSYTASTGKHGKPFRAYVPGRVHVPVMLGTASVGLLAGLELRVACPLVEERRERALQMPQRLLQRDRRHLGQERQVLRTLPLGQHRGRLHVADALAQLIREFKV